MQRVIWAFILVLFLVTNAFQETAISQETISYASISGQVTDPSGAVVEKAEVNARQVETNLSTIAVTDSDGRFRISYLKSGRYELTVTQKGFSQAVRFLNLTLGSAFYLPISLGLGSAETKVEVNSEAPVLELARSQIAGTVSQAEINNLPLNGRSFLDLALLVPGVSPTNTASTQLYPETSAVAGQGISVGGQRNFSNSFIVDGLSANDDAAGLVGTFYSLESVHEFQVVTSGGQAEFGRALGGYVNMVTKGGTNQIHGGLYGFFRNQRFNARNPILGSKLPLTQTQHGGSIGGPIIRGRTFYFTNFEQRLLNQAGLITIAPSDVTAINARLTAVGYLGSSVVTGLYSNPVHNANFLAKLDHEFSKNNHFSMRYSLYDVFSANSRGVGGLNSASAAASLDDGDHTIAVSDVAALSPRIINEIRGQFTLSDLSAVPNDEIGPSVSVSGVASFGRLQGSPTGRVNRLYELVDNLAYHAGKHAFRVGTDFLYNDLKITYPRQIRGAYSFSSLATFLSGAYNNAGFTQTFGNSAVSQTNPNVGLYAQDEWKMSSRLTLNFGIRYDLQFIETVATDTNNLSPRLGFAWSPFSARHTVVRGGFGLYYDRIPLRALANALLSAGNTTTLTSSSQVSISLSPTQTGAPVFPNILTALPTGVLVNLTTMDRNMQNAYSDQGSLEIEHQLGDVATLSVGYQHLRGRNLIISVNQNVPTCVASGNNNGCRPNLNYANNSQYSSRANSQYDGLHLSFVRRQGAYGTFRISYTYSKSLNNVSEFFFSSPIDNFNLGQDWGRSDDDQRHRVFIDGTIQTSTARANSLWEQLINGFQLAGSLQYYSGLPFNVTTGATTIQGTTARPTVNGAFIQRNAGIGFDSFNVNLRLSRTLPLSERFKLQGLAESFNVFNRRNSLIPNGVFGTGSYPTSPRSTFGQPSAVGDPRSLQIALKLSF